MRKTISELGREETPKGTLLKLIAGVKIDEQRKIFHLQTYKTLWPKGVPFPENWPVEFTLEYDESWRFEEEEIRSKSSV